MTDFNPKAEAAALSKMLNTYELATLSPGGQTVAARIMDEIHSEYCKLTPDQQNKSATELSALKGTALISDGFGTVIGVTSQTYNDYPHAYASFVCEQKE